MKEEVLEVEAVEESAGDAGGPSDADATVRPLPQRRPASELDAWRGEVKVAAMAAAGGLAAGAVAVAAVNAVKLRTEKGRRSPKGILRRAGRSDGVVASRSFLIDVHVLGR